MIHNNVHFAPFFHLSSPLFKTRHRDNDKKRTVDLMLGVEIVKERGTLDSFSYFLLFVFDDC